ncbi:MAG: hypothetical protein HRT88_00210 [Lentisphaeraceae bacterium]|nr:hypothetical protein [Lentisphaeraceae bacterium]
MSDTQQVSVLDIDSDLTFNKMDHALHEKLMNAEPIHPDDDDVFRDTIAYTVALIQNSEGRINATKTAIIHSLLAHPNPEFSRLPGVKIGKIANCSSALITKTAQDNGLVIWTKEKTVLEYLDINAVDLETCIAKDIAQTLHFALQTVEKAIKKKRLGTENETTPKVKEKKKSAKEIISELEGKLQERTEELEERTEELEESEEDRDKLLNDNMRLKAEKDQDKKTMAVMQDRIKELEEKK